MLFHVSTKYGELSGIPTMTEHVMEYRGIPYAEKPIGPNRWREPQPLLPWKGIRQCNQYGPACIQLERKAGTFYHHEFYDHRFHNYPLDEWSEDCLYLNIWTPAKNSEDKLPVFVWIHGGGFVQGYSHEPRSNGEVMASKGIIVVSFNYRLGIFGFFAHPELKEEQDGHCGNYAIMDQIAALKWVYENISAFGGDPNNITVGGQSAGSYSVEAMSVIKQTRGLFQRAIMQSGVLAAVGRYGLRYKSQQDLEYEGIAFMDFAEKKSLKELRELSSSELNRIYMKYQKAGYDSFSSICEDQYLFFKNPSDSFASGEEHIKNLIIGATTRETQVRPYVAGITKENFDEKVRTYFNGDYLWMTEMKPENDEQAEDMFNRSFAWMMNNASLAICEYMSNHSGKKVYNYSFERNLPGHDNPGPFHAACIWYMFGNLHNCWRPFTEEDFELEHHMNQYWINFIKTGNPNGEGVPVWENYMHENPKTLILDVNACEMKTISSPCKGFYALRDKLILKK